MNRGQRAITAVTRYIVLCTITISDNDAIYVKINDLSLNTSDVRLLLKHYDCFLRKEEVLTQRRCQLRRLYTVGNRGVHDSKTCRAPQKNQEEEEEKNAVSTVDEWNVSMEQKTEFILKLLYRMALKVCQKTSELEDSV